MMRNGLLKIAEMIKKNIEWYSGTDLFMYFGPVSVE